jgi:hypothetical protein
MPHQLNSRQRVHQQWAAEQITKAASHFSPAIWADVTPDQAQLVNEIKQHLQQAFDRVQELGESNPVNSERTLPQTMEEFLAMPLQEHPLMNTWLFNILKGYYAPEGKEDNFTAQDVLNNGLTLQHFKRCRGAGKQKLAELVALFGLHGVNVPLL